MNKHYIITLGLVGIAFTGGYFLSPDLKQNEITINTREDLVDLLDIIYAEIDRNNIPVYYYDLEFLAVVDETIQVIPISVTNPNSTIPMNTKSETRYWMQQINQGIDDMSKRFEGPRVVHVTLNPDENGVVVIQKGNWTYQGSSNFTVPDIETIP